jgi:phosphoribosylformylglycinamidine cyclo-ligase
MTKARTTKTAKKAYARAGVDVDLGNLVKKRIQARVKSTHGPEVLGKIGGFGGLFAPNFSGMREPVLVASVDGVGTKLKIAFAMDRHDTVGADLVNHCINDIAVWARGRSSSSTTSARNGSSRRCSTKYSPASQKHAVRRSAH